MIIETLFYDFCLWFTYYGGHFFYAGFFDTFYALELFQQGGFGFLANSFDIVQGRCYLSFASFIPVEGNGKAMYFILYLFQ